MKDLLEPENSNLYNNSKNLRSTDNRGVFKTEFNNILESNSKNGRTNSNDLKEYLIKNGLGIYFPYSENFKDMDIENITIGYLSRGLPGPYAIYDGWLGPNSQPLNSQSFVYAMPTKVF